MMGVHVCCGRTRIMSTSSKQTPFVWHATACRPSALPTYDRLLPVVVNHLVTTWRTRSNHREFPFRLVATTFQEYYSTSTTPEFTAMRVKTEHLIPPPSDRTGAVLFQIGSFSPITYAHLRLFEAAKDKLRQAGFHVCGGYLSPANDAYKKSSLVPATHRLSMCRLALRELEHIAIDEWEARADRFVPSYEVASRLHTALSAWRRHIQLFLVCGSDLLLSMGNPNSWPRQSVLKLVSFCRFIVKSRNGQKPDISDDVPLVQEVMWIDAWVGDHSSTLVRHHLKRGQSITFMTPKPVIDYIHQHRLYR